MIDISEAFSSGQAAWALDGYFQRTLAASYGEEPHFSNDFASYFLTNEDADSRLLSKIEGKKGAFVGVGQVLPFAFGRDATHAYVVDRDASIPYAFTPLFGAMLTAAQSRAEFLSLLLAKRIPNGDIDATDPALTGHQLLWAFRNARPDPTLGEKLDGILVDAISRRLPWGIREGAGKSSRLILEMFRSLYSAGYPHKSLLNLAVSDGKGHDGLLSSEMEFLRQRALFADGRMTGFAADLAGAPWRRFLSRMEEDVGIVYLSNIESWIFEEAMRTNRYSPIHSLFDNLSALPGADEALVISTLNLMHPEVSPLVDYIARAIPPGLSPEEAGAIAASFVSVRVFIGEMSIPADDSEYAPYLQNWLGKPFGEGGKEIIEAAREVLGGKRMPTDAFEAELKVKSEGYRQADPAVKILF
ncbi:MAG TPA: hypothetical protein PLZ86_09975, partial [bacterium]|nr:hypothetical protein [bacterium]